MILVSLTAVDSAGAKSLRADLNKLRNSEASNLQWRFLLNWHGLHYFVSGLFSSHVLDYTGKGFLSP